ncbi:MAG: tryptophan--tRNA ligase [Lentisphaeria bacterium]|nr:tryptophan--tRNA ligase [Lentisphaeria bacterium]
MRILSGIQPSGTLHIGNYLGMMKPALEMQNSGETFLFIADYHSLTTSPDPAILRGRVEEVALDFLACGIDPDKTVFFRQSSVPEVTELTWILNCLTPMGLLERCHSYKDKLNNGFSPNAGLFDYPVLMASDILAYNSDIVPVGKDQKQHLEVTCEIARKFNNRYGDILTIPKESIREEVAVVPGLDGRKMSKSYDNTIEIFGNAKKIRKKFMKIVTDSKELDEVKDPETCNVFDLFKLFADEKQQAELAAMYRAGGMGYGHAKQALFDLFWETLRTSRERRAELENNMDYVREILVKGGKKARTEAAITLDKVRFATGLR